MQPMMSYTVRPSLRVWALTAALVSTADKSLQVLPTNAMGLEMSVWILIGMCLCVSRDIRESAHQKHRADDEDPRPMHTCVIYLGPRVGISSTLDPLVPAVCPRSRVLPLPRVRSNPDDHSCPGKGQARLTFPKSRMKQSPLLKLSQDTGTSVARTTRRPLTWKSLCTTTSLGTTCLNPDATPPFCQAKEQC